MVRPKKDFKRLLTDTLKAKTAELITEPNNSKKVDHKKPAFDPVYDKLRTNLIKLTKFLALYDSGLITNDILRHAPYNKNKLEESILKIVEIIDDIGYHPQLLKVEDDGVSREEFLEWIEQTADESFIARYYSGFLLIIDGYIRKAQAIKVDTPSYYLVKSKAEGKVVVPNGKEKIQAFLEENNLTMRGTQRKNSPRTNSVNLTTRIPASLYERFSDTVKAQGLKKPAVVTQIFKAYLESPSHLKIKSKALDNPNDASISVVIDKCLKKKFSDTVKEQGLKQPQVLIQLLENYLAKTESQEPNL